MVVSDTNFYQALSGSKIDGTVLASGEWSQLDCLTELNSTKKASKTPTNFSMSSEHFSDFAIVCITIILVQTHQHSAIKIKMCCCVGNMKFIL